MRDWAVCQAVDLTWMTRIVLLPGLSTPQHRQLPACSSPNLGTDQTADIKNQTWSLVWEHGHDNRVVQFAWNEIKSLPDESLKLFKKNILVPNPWFFLQSCGSGISQHKEKAKIFFLPRQIRGQQLLPSERRQEAGRWCRMSISGHVASGEEPSVP